MGDSAVQTTVKVAELVWETKLDQIPREVVNYSKSLALSALSGMVSGGLKKTPKGKEGTMKYVSRVTAGADSPYKSLKDLIDAAKERLRGRC